MSYKLKNFKIKFLKAGKPKMESLKYYIKQKTQEQRDIEKT